jgi:hypothetical protein
VADEASFASLLESLLNDGHHCRLIILLFSPDNHLGHDRNCGRYPQWVASGCTRRVPGVIFYPLNT